jgi:small GTP-binding protein
MDGQIPSFKVVIAGATGVGKSSIINRLVQNDFNEHGPATCGADFYPYTCSAGTDTIRLQIWDTAGQERFRAISRSYFRNAVGAILVYDLTSVASFDEVANWLAELHSLALPNAHILLVGNKSDLEAKRQVGMNYVKEFADRNHLEALETSARSGKGVREAFARLALEVYTKVLRNEIRPLTGVRGMRVAELTATEPGKKKSRC